MPEHDLVVRQFERNDLRLPIELIVAETHRRQVRFAGAAEDADQHVLRGSTADLSTGGAGLICRQFLPRGCEATLRIFAPAGDAETDPLFEHAVKVRRTYQIDPRPEYFVGVAFAGAGADLDRRIEAVLARLPGASGGGAADA